jgi:tRNA(Ile)-lysidine synthase
MLLQGRPVRGGGRASSPANGDGMALDVTRLAERAPALQRRLLRFAAEQFGAALDFPATESLRSLALVGRAGQKLALPHGLHAERTARELRLNSGLTASPKPEGAETAYTVAIPGEIEAPAFGLRLRIEIERRGPNQSGQDGLRDQFAQTATLRNWKPGDRVRLRHSGGPRKIKEVLARLKVTGTERALWPVLEVGGRILWMRGVEIEPEPGLIVTAEFPSSDVQNRAQKHGKATHVAWGDSTT